MELTITLHQLIACMALCCVAIWLLVWFYGQRCRERGRNEISNPYQPGQRAAYDRAKPFFNR